MTEMVSVGSFQNVPNALAAFLLLDHFFGEVSEERRPSTFKTRSGLAAFARLPHGFALSIFPIRVGWKKFLCSVTFAYSSRRISNSPVVSIRRHPTTFRTRVQFRCSRHARHLDLGLPAVSPQHIVEHPCRCPDGFRESEKATARGCDPALPEPCLGAPRGHRNLLIQQPVHARIPIPPQAKHPLLPGQHTVDRLRRNRP